MDPIQPMISVFLLKFLFSLDFLTKNDHITELQRVGPHTRQNCNQSKLKALSHLAIVH